MRRSLNTKHLRPYHSIRSMGHQFFPGFHIMYALYDLSVGGGQTIAHLVYPFGRVKGDGLVPYAMGGPFEKFTITELNGKITDNSFTLNFICGEYPVTYSGTK